MYLDYDRQSEVKIKKNELYVIKAALTFFSFSLFYNYSDDDDPN